MAQETTQVRVAQYPDNVILPAAKADLLGTIPVGENGARRVDIGGTTFIEIRANGQYLIVEMF